MRYDMHDMRSFSVLGACHPIICAAIPSEGRSRSRKSQAKAAEPFPPTAGPKLLPAPACAAPPRSSPCPAGHMMLGGWPTKPTPSEAWPTPEQMTARSAGGASDADLNLPSLQVRTYVRGTTPCSVHSILSVLSVLPVQFKSASEAPPALRAGRKTIICLWGRMGGLGP